MSMSTSLSNPLDAQLEACSGRVVRMVGRRISDARVHAEAGRMADAVDRLGELHEDLVRHLQDARATAYRRAIAGTGLASDPEAEAVARTHPVLGRTPHDIGRSITAAGQHLGVAANAAVAAPAADRPGIFAGWEARQRAAIAAQARSLISDAQVAIHSAIAALATERS